MKKEVILAIVIGFGLGLVITFGVYTAQKALKRTSTTPSPAPTTDQPLAGIPSHSLTITTPEDESLIGENTITVTGNTSPNSLVTLVTETEAIVIYANDQGSFQAEIKLVGGANDITLTSITPTGLKAEQQLTLVYSTAKIEP